LPSAVIQVAGSLSGGEQQMCAIGRALIIAHTHARRADGGLAAYVDRLFDLMKRLQQQ
jgi:ABC-type branched-subunit amino acid transport system ATPase component